MGAKRPAETLYPLAIFMRVAQASCLCFFAPPRPVTGRMPVLRHSPCSISRVWARTCQVVGRKAVGMEVHHVGPKAILFRFWVP